MQSYTLGAGAFRGAAINSFLFKKAVAAGLREGETAACLANLQAITKTLTPWIYGGLYTAFKSGSHERMRGAPYLVCCAALVVAQAMVAQLAAQDLT
eukprot:COSAG05_NODE_3069_length_2359_cov_2.105310_3_plen_97_part_00